MCGGIHYGKVERLVSVERWSCSRGASCVVEYTGEVEGLVSVERWSYYRGCSFCCDACQCQWTPGVGHQREVCCFVSEGGLSPPQGEQVSCLYCLLVIRTNTQQCKKYSGTGQTLLYMVIKAKQIHLVHPLPI